MKISKKSSRRLDGQYSNCAYELLDPRRFLAGIVFDSVTQVVSVDGSEAVDLVRVTDFSATEISIVFTDVETRNFTKTDVRQIVFTARGGDDWYKNESGIDSIAYGQFGNDRFVGGSGRDRFRGGIGDDRLLGGGNNDYLAGDGDDDVVDGGEGNDRLDGSAGNDHVMGSFGTDLIFGGIGDDYVDGGNDDDEIFGYDGNDILLGGYGSDSIAGQDGDDDIYGQGGFDHLYGNNGRDRVYGGNAADRIAGGDANDQLYGGDGIDAIYGQMGNDLIVGGNHADTIFGDQGDDTVYGGAQPDIIYGGDGEDRLFGQQDSDVLHGDSGNDILDGGSERDLLIGGAGNDDFYAESNDETRRDPDDDSSENDAFYWRPVGLSNRLTVSFAPDGTSIFDQFSSLFTAFSTIVSSAQIEDGFVRSFGLWAEQGNLDVGVVTDSGDPFGAAGRAYGDSRFGDVRIGAIPMAGDVYAVAVGQGDLVSGTWAGDILFNSNASFKNAEHFFAVALHEVGHALGLKHQVDVNSAMHRYSNRLDLSPLDITNFRALYGVRQLDSYDVDELVNNDDASRATDIPFSTGALPPGTFPSIVYADISAASDVDYFKFESPQDYSGQITFTLISDGISLLSPRLTLLSKDLAVLSQIESTTQHGDILSISVSATQSEGKFFIKVDGGSGLSAGSFSLVAKLNDRNRVTDNVILTAARTQELARFEQAQLDIFFANPNGFLINDDEHSNEDIGTATQLETEDGYAAQSRFRRAASLTDAADVDVYKLETPAFGSTANPALIISVRSIVVGGMIPNVGLFDSENNPVAAEVIVNGRGEYVLQVQQAVAQTEYYVRVSSDAFVPFASGNYEMDISYVANPVQYARRAVGTVDGGQKQYHSLHIAESQMMQFGLQVASFSGPADALVWATIYDQFGAIVYQCASRAGELRTSNTVYFRPGSYTIEIEASTPLLAGVTYDFLGLDVGDGQGPTFSDSSTSPFEKTPDGKYIYPDDVLTKATFVFVDGLSSNQTTPPPDQPPTNLFRWYWGLSG